MVTTVGPQDVLDAVRVAREALRGAGCPSGVRGSREEWAAVAGELQSLVNEATAAQDAAIVRLAAVEPQWCEDGTLIEVHQPLGHGALDAPAVVSGVLGLTAVAAERRVRHALRTAADGPDGHGVVHRARGVARGDGVGRAGRVPRAGGRGGAGGVPARGRGHGRGVTRGVVRGGGLRPPPPPGPPDCWRGSARTCSASAHSVPGPSRACGGGSTSPASTPGSGRSPPRRPAGRGPRSTSSPSGTSPTAPANASTGPAPRPSPTSSPGRRPSTSRSSSPSPPRPAEGPAPASSRSPRRAPPSRSWSTGAGSRRPDEPGSRRATRSPAPSLDEGESLATGAYRPGKRLAELVRARDGRCRFPGCHVAARFCDLDHVTPWPAGPTTATNLACLCRRHHRVKQRPGWTATLHPDATRSPGPTPPAGPASPTPSTTSTRSSSPPAPPTPPDPAPAGIPSLTLPDAPHSTLEHRHEHHLGAPRPRPACRTDTHDLTPRRLRVTTPSHRTRQRPRATGRADPPPF